jgi:DNA-binding beta-propeller fold protein YncE
MRRVLLVLVLAVAGCSGPAANGPATAVDTSTLRVVHRVTLADSPEGVAVGFGSLWTVRQNSSTVDRLDRAGRLVAHIAVGATPRLVAIGARQVFVANLDGGTLSRIDPATDAATTSPRICTGPQAMAIHAGTVWVTCTASDTVVAVDEATLRVLGQATVAGEPDAIRVVGDRVFVLATAGPTLVELADRPTQPATLSRASVSTAVALADRANVDLAEAGGQLYVTSFRENAVYRVALP